jgi:succinate-acetate transporter protein
MSNNIVQLQKRESWTKGGALVSHLEDSEITRLEERAAATIADPSTLGLWTFATATWILGIIFTGWIQQVGFTAIVPIVMVFGGVAQFIAGLYAFRRAYVLPATAFCVFGAFYTTVGFFFVLQAANTIGSTGASAMLFGFFLESLAFIAFALTIASMKTNFALMATFAALTVGYALVGIPYVSDNVDASTLGTIGGWFMVGSAFFAYYAGMAMVVNSTWNQTLLPIGGEP